MKLNEALGVALPTTFYLHKLTYLVIDRLYNFIDELRELGYSEPEEEFSENINIIVNYNDIRRLIPVGNFREYAKFPVSEFVITLELNKKRNSDLEDDITIGGWASPFAKGREKYASRFADPIKQVANHSISVHLGIEINYTSKFRKISQRFPMFENTTFFKKIEKTISHELNHIYEIYNRKMSGKKEIEVSLTWASIIDENYYGVPKPIYDYWINNFMTYIYESEPHEINASTQEAYSIASRVTLQRFKKTATWKNAIEMRDWSYKEFIIELTKIIFKNRLNPRTTIESMIYEFLYKYQDLCIELGEEPFYDPWKLYEKTPDEIFMIFQKKINSAGEKLIRNYGRLYTLKGTDDY